jgi:hypothetical protein
VDRELELAIRGIDEAVEHMRSQKPAALAEDYLHAIAAVEALPENRSGVDKSRVWWEYAEMVRHFQQARRL